MLSKALKENFELHGMIAYYPGDESEVLECFKKEEIDAVVMDPSLPYDFLTDPTTADKRVNYIGAGLILLEKIKEETKKNSQNVKIIFLTVVSFQTLSDEGVPKEILDTCIYFRQPTMVIDIVKAINKM